MLVLVCYYTCMLKCTGSWWTNFTDFMTNRLLLQQCVCITSHHSASLQQCVWYCMIAVHFLLSAACVTLLEHVKNTIEHLKVKGCACDVILILCHPHMFVHAQHLHVLAPLIMWKEISTQLQHRAISKSVCMSEMKASSLTRNPSLFEVWTQD